MVRMLRRKKSFRSYGGALARCHPATLAIVIGLLAAPAAADAKTLQLVAFGDSLMAGYDLPAESAYPAQLEAALRKAGLDVTIGNASVSGDTTAGGLDRLDWSIPDGTDGVLLELGANDMLRGQDPALTRTNLATMIVRLKARHIAVYLLGMKADPALGPDYTSRFDAIYPDLSKADGVPLYPFLLDGVAGTPSRQLRDGLHPNQDGITLMVDRTLPGISAWIKSLAVSR